MSLSLHYKDNWYEAAMESREGQLASLFGVTSPPDQVFKPRDQQLEIALPGFAFLRLPPTQERTFWIYITHGLSQPLDFNTFQQGFDNGLSGLGCEFVLASQHEEVWPLNMLELLVQYTRNTRKPIYPFHRIPATDLMRESSGGHLLALSAPGYPTELRTLSGVVHLVHLVGVTAGEITKAKKYPGTAGSQILENVLRHFGIGCVTDRNRKSVSNHPDFITVWQSYESAAQ